ncbi:MAG: hypothetical protein VXV96_10635 [Bdellovibrionota bacterium]|nr:hypothetical protein [Bdellovibrionota bacterium]
MIKAIALLLILTAQAQASTSWKIERQWNTNEEELFSEFIYKIGESIRKRECRTTDECLRSQKANPLFAKNNPRGMTSIFSDCADLPYILRSYFAFMRKLPFAYPKGITFYSPELDRVRTAYYKAKREYDSYNFFSRPREVRTRYKELKKELERLQKEAGDDLRYSRSGNKITGMRKIQGGENINQVFDDIVGSISTAIFRVNGSLFDSGDVFKDTYPAKISRESLTIGSIIYDPAGHIALVAKVTDAGKIYLIDAHPDNSITYISYGEKFSRSPLSRGAGFVKWRPYQKKGKQYVQTLNKDLPFYSLEQYQGYPERPEVSFRRAEYRFNDVPMDFYHFVRARLSLQGLSINPLEEVSTGLDDLCRDFIDRVDAVNKAVSSGMINKSAPDNLPENIYGTHGDWETYSTPSRDARLKASVREIYNSINEYLYPSADSSFEIDYNGFDLQRDLARIFKEKTASCKYSFTKSNGERYNTNLKTSLDKLFKLSFDPYQCIELRWGLTGSELESCNQDKDKWQWYEAQQALRNQVDRDYSQFMGYDISGLRSSGLGVSQIPNYDFDSLLGL